MKRYITMEFRENDSEKVKGEEFDTALESELEGLDLDGWEVKSVRVSSESFKKQAQPALEQAAQLEQQLQDLIQGVVAGKAGEAWPGNPSQTYAEMLGWTWELARPSPSTK